MCKRCSAYIDLRDYHLAGVVSKNFKTKGLFVIEPKGNVFNSEATVGDAVIKGKFLGKLIAQRSLTVYSTAEIKGHFKTARFIVPTANRFYWKEIIEADSVELAGELVAKVRAKGAVLLKSTARLFGDVEASNLVVEAGAVLVGQMKIGQRKD